MTKGEAETVAHVICDSESLNRVALQELTFGIWRNKALIH